MSSPAPSASTTRWVGIVLGVVALALLVCLAVLLPKATGGDDALELPDTLPGGYTAADLPSAFGGEYADQADELSERQATSREHGDEVLAGVYDHDAVTRVYASEDLSQAVFVQAFRAAGGAFAPETISAEGDAASGAPTQELVREGDAVCIVQRAAAAQAGADPAAAAGAPAYVTCQRSEGDLTVQASSAETSAEDMVAIVDAVWDSAA